MFIFATDVARMAGAGACFSASSAQCRFRVAVVCNDDVAKLIKLLNLSLNL